MSRVARLAGACLLGVLGVAHAADLTVDVAAVDSHGKGRLAVWLYASSAEWDAPRRPVLAQGEVLTGRGHARFVIRGLAPGEYAVMALNDLDGNGLFDRNALGIRRDGYGFSNNPVALSRPGFARVRFAVPAPRATATVRMR